MNERYPLHSLDGKRAEPKPPPALEDPSVLTRGRARMALLRDLAMGEWDDESIAASANTTISFIREFRLMYEDEISEVRAALAGQLAIESAGLWISKRQNRLAEMQTDFEDIDLVIEVMRRNTRDHLTDTVDGSDSMARGDAFDANMLLGSRRHQNLLRSKLAILRAAADELSPRNNSKEAEQDASNTIRYVIESDGDTGVSGDDIIGSLT
jgi:hypothetical protein